MLKQVINCKDELSLGSILCDRYGAKETKAIFQSNDHSPEKIIKTAMKELAGNEEALITGVLEGSPWWAYVALRYMPDVGSHREELLLKASHEPMSAFHTLYYVKDLGHCKDVLLSRTCEDPGWAQMTLKHVNDLGPYKEKLESAIVHKVNGMTHSNQVSAFAKPPVEVGWGYNTYFVNLTGRPIWVMWNTGMRGSSGSISGPVMIKKGQNIGYGRGGACISEVRAWFSEPKKRGDIGPWFAPGGGGWDKWGINGCNNWGYVIRANGQYPSISEDEAVTWSYGQLGMPYKYPPSNGEE